METRKVQRVGGGTYTVSIPGEWAETHGVEAGGTAYLYPHRDGSLLVRWDEREHSELAATEIELEGSDPRIAERMLTAAYTAGFERVTLRDGDGGIESETRRAIDACARGLPGIEIAEEADDRVTVRDVLDASDVSVRQSILQLRFVTLSMHEAATGLFAGETTDAQRVLEREEEVDRSVRRIERTFNRSLSELAELDRLGLTRSELFEYRVTARQLERVAGHAVRIARCTQRADHAVPEAPSTELRALSDEAHRVIEDASGAVVDGEGSTDAAHDALDRCERLVQEARSADRALARRESSGADASSRVLDSIVRIAECGAAIADARLRTSLRE
jgi:phosphate uptake regulator